MYNKTDRKVKPIIVENYRTVGVSITGLQVRYKRSFRMEKHIYLHNIYIYIYIYIYVCMYVCIPIEIQRDRLRITYYLPFRR